MLQPTVIINQVATEGTLVSTDDAEKKKKKKRSKVRNPTQYTSIYPAVRLDLDRNYETNCSAGHGKQDGVKKNIIVCCPHDFSDREFAHTSH